jgi:hypothetical protein
MQTFPSDDYSSGEMLFKIITLNTQFSSRQTQEIVKNVVQQLDNQSNTNMTICSTDNETAGI